MANLSSILAEKSARGVVRARLQMGIREDGKWKKLVSKDLSVREPKTLWVIWRGIVEHLRGDLVIQDRNVQEPELFGRLCPELNEEMLVARLDTLLRLKGLSITAAPRSLHSQVTSKAASARLLLHDAKSGLVAMIRVSRDGEIKQEENW